MYRAYILFPFKQLWTNEFPDFLHNYFCRDYIVSFDNRPEDLLISNSDNAFWREKTDSHYSCSLRERNRLRWILRLCNCNGSGDFITHFGQSGHDDKSGERDVDADLVPSPTGYMDSTVVAIHFVMIILITAAPAAVRIGTIVQSRCTRMHVVPVVTGQHDGLFFCLVVLNPVGHFLLPPPWACAAFLLMMWSCFQQFLLPVQPVPEVASSVLEAA